MSTERTNQGEGNRKADRRYRESTREFVKSGEVEERESERRHTTREQREELEQAENEGRKRAKAFEDSGCSDTKPAP